MRNERMYRVMLADDEPIMRKALKTLTNWADLGCEIVYIATNGQEVLDNLENVMPDILITDIRMPGKDGIQLAKHIQESHLNIQVILLTAYADFSYAQSALKYGVIDYVTKTGVFDGLVAAVLRAKEKIEKDTAKEEWSRDVVGENFFKAVFDGSLYEKDEIRKNFQSLSLELNGYVVLLLRFRMEKDVDSGRRKMIYKSLSNFYTMVFAERMLQGMAVERDLFAIILHDVDEEGETFIGHSCGQIVDMMDNFMKLSVSIGVSRRHTDITDLEEAYTQAAKALEVCFVDETSKINFYVPAMNNSEPYPAEIDNQVDAVYHEILKGNRERAMACYEQLILLQRTHQCSANVIKNMGILIQSKCRKVLGEYDKNIYEITGIQGSISKEIYESRYMEDFQEIMELIIGQTSEFIRIAANKKKSLIYDCEKYIEEHYDKSIMVTDIAESIGASASYLSRIYKEATGQTIIYTINMKKVEKAKLYLKNTDMKIYEIADALGFDNTTYFSHFFKKYTGISPKDFKGEE